MRWVPSESRVEPKKTCRSVQCRYGMLSRQNRSNWEELALGQWLGQVETWVPFSEVVGACSRTAIHAIEFLQ